MNPYQPPATEIARPIDPPRVGQILTGIVSTGFVLDDVVTSLALSAEGIDVGRFTATALLAFFLARGSRWARVVVVALLLVSVALTVALSFYDALPPTPARFVRAGVHLLFAALLTLARPIQRFFAEARSARKS